MMGRVTSKYLSENKMIIFNLPVDVQIEKKYEKEFTLLCFFFVAETGGEFGCNSCWQDVRRRVRGERVTSDYNCSGWQTGDCWFRNPPQKYWRNISPLMLMSVWVRREDKTVWTCFNFPAPFDCQSISPWVVRDHYPNIKTFTVYFTFHELKTSRALFSSENISYLN